MSPHSPSQATQVSLFETYSFGLRINYGPSIFSQSINSIVVVLFPFYLSFIRSSQINLINMLIDVLIPASFGNAARSFAKTLASLLEANAQLVELDMSRCGAHDEVTDSIN